VTAKEGNNEGDQGVVYEIDEGPKQRYAWTKFEGNEIASDARLRTQIDSKPGILWLFKGQIDRDVIKEDQDKLTAYYRSLGFFRATIEPKLTFDKDQEWGVLTFVIDEGPRYVIRSISVDGNQVFSEENLLAGTELRPGSFFDLGKMNSDVRLLKDSYGANGYIKSVVKAEPQFFEEPGQLDLVYRIDEGRQHRVGEIKINIEGEYPHTRQDVVLNRINLREGDIIDIRKIRSSERRIMSSQLFENGPLASPEITVLPRESGTQMASPSANQERF
jgi:outer membrane protein insertion porin family